MTRLFHKKHPTTTGAPQVAKTQIPILLYHFIAEMDNDLAVPPKAFAEHMEYLAKESFTTLSLDQLYYSLTGGMPLPEKPVVITFDDGYLDQYTNALPVLLERRFTAAFFIFVQPTDAGEKEYMTWEQLKYLKYYGMSVEAHSLSHADLTNLSRDEQTKEVCQSKEKIARNLGSPVNYFAYPYGKFNGSTVSTVKNCGYKAAFAVGSGKVKPTDELFRLKRQVVTDDFAGFKQLVD